MQVSMQQNVYKKRRIKKKITNERHTESVLFLFKTETEDRDRYHHLRFDRRRKYKYLKEETSETNEDKKNIVLLINTMTIHQYIGGKKCFAVL